MNRDRYMTNTKLALNRYLLSPTVGEKAVQASSGSWPGLRRHKMPLSKNHFSESLRTSW
jgi:hypothetical protein